MTATRSANGSTNERPTHQVGADPIDIDSVKLRAEFTSMPALCLTVEQVARLLNLPVAGAARLLADLDRDGFLIRMPSGKYRLAEPLMC